MWSTVAIVRPGKRTFHPRARSMSNACGVVTSCTRCSPTKSCVCPFGSFRTVWAFQTFSRRVMDIASVDGTSGIGIGDRGSGLGARGSGLAGSGSRLGARRLVSLGSQAAVSTTCGIGAETARRVFWTAQKVKRLGIVRFSFRDLTPGRRQWTLRSLLIVSPGCCLRHTGSSSGRRSEASATSIPSNIAEGHAHHGDRAFLRHVRIALGSLAELDTQLELALRLNLLDRAVAATISRSRVQVSCSTARAALKRRVAERHGRSAWQLLRYHRSAVAALMPADPETRAPDRRRL